MMVVVMVLLMMVVVMDVVRWQSHPEPQRPVSRSRTMSHVLWDGMEDVWKMRVSCGWFKLLRLESGVPRLGQPSVGKSVLCFVLEPKVGLVFPLSVLQHPRSRSFQQLSGRHHFLLDALDLLLPSRRRPFPRYSSRIFCRICLPRYSPTSQPTSIVS